MSRKNKQINNSNSDDEEQNFVKDDCNFIFTINNYSSIKKKKYIDSPRFSMHLNKNIKWYIRLFPNGDLEENKNYVSLFLIQDFESRTLHENVFYFSLSIIGKNNKLLSECRHFTKIDKKNEGYGEGKFIKKEVLSAKKDNYLSNDTLSILCTIILGKNNIKIPKAVEDKKERHTSKKIKLEVTAAENTADPKIDPLEKMYLDPTFCDVTFSSSSKELKAHKCLLAAVSPVFENIFKKNITDVSNTLMAISDISFEVMNELLRYIYTKKINNQNISCELIVAANKYEIQDLKNYCEKYLCETINIDNVVKYLVIAEDNNAELLKKMAISLIIKNKNILGTKPEYKQITESRPELMKQIFWAVFNDQ